MSPASLIPGSADSTDPSHPLELNPYEYITFDLARSRPNKTVDIGQNGVALSLDAQGRVCTSPIGKGEVYLCLTDVYRCYKRAHTILNMASS